MANKASNRREQLARQLEAEQKAKRMNRIIIMVVGALAAIIVAVFIFVLVQQNATNKATDAAQVTPPNAANNAIVLGQAAAPAPTVTIYFDYQCGGCASFEQNYSTMLTTEAQAGTWTLQNKTLTFMDRNLGNTSSTRAAVAAACADGAGVYSAYSNAVFLAQDIRPGNETYPDELLRVTVPAMVGITGDALTTFQACYDNVATRDFTEAVAKSAYDEGVTATPSVAVNGKVLNLQQLTDGSPEGLKAFILANA